MIRDICCDKKNEHIFVLENYTNFIRIYSFTGQHLRDIETDKDSHVYELNILGMAFSQAEGRLGSVNTDYTLSFWDTSDNFSFEKTIPNKTNNLHIQIYFINY